MTLAEGDRVPTDALLHAAQDLEADESLLTGESVPARKVAASDNAPQGVRPGRDGAPAVWSGTLIVRGTGIAELFATGPRTEIGRIGCSLAGLETEPPRLQAQTRHVVTLFALAGAIVSIGVVIL